MGIQYCLDSLKHSLHHLKALDKLADADKDIQRAITETASHASTVVFPMVQTLDAIYRGQPVAFDLVDEYSELFVTASASHGVSLPIYELPKPTSNFKTPKCTPPILMHHPKSPFPYIHNSSISPKLLHNNSLHPPNITRKIQTHTPCKLSKIIQLTPVSLSIPYHLSTLSPYIYCLSRITNRHYLILSVTHH